MQSWFSKRFLVVAFVCWWVAFAAWAFATPPWGAPDEFQHAYRAYAAVRGEVYVKPANAEVGTGGFVDVPRGWIASANDYKCYATHPTVTAQCLPALTNDASRVRTPSTAARYDPVYYLFVGLGSLVTGPKHGLLAMRLVSAALSAFFLALAITSAASLKRPRFAMAVVAIATTPMVGFLAGSVNPNSLEIAAAISLWVNGFAWFQHEDPHARSILMRRAAISAIAMVLTRALSPLWLLVIVGVLLIAVRPDLRLRSKLSGLTPWAPALIAVCSVAAVLWTVVSHTLVLNILTSPHHWSLLHRLHLAWGGIPKQRYYLRGTVGIYGWLDTFPPESMILAWTLVAFGLLALALWLSNWRTRIGLATLIVAVLALPVVLEAHDLNVSGFVWQPRYTMPISLGVVLLSGMILAVRKRLFSDGRQELVAAGALLVVAIMTVSSGFVFALSRNVVGTDHAIALSGSWNPPLSGIVLTIAELLAMVALSAVVLTHKRDAEISQPSLEYQEPVTE